MKNLLEYQGIEIDENEVRKFTSEREFTHLAFELTREAGIYLIDISCIMPRKDGLTRDEAILCAHVVRISKLFLVVIEQSSKDRQEILNIFSRIIYESIINLMFLLKNDSHEIFDSFVKYSLQEDKRLWNRIHDNIRERENDELPIETRMKKSILKNTEIGEISLDDIDENSKAPWGDKSIYHRAKDLGLDKMHLHLFSGQSHAIHGNWNDLIFYHLQKKEKYFVPDCDWNSARPQMLIAQGLLAMDALKLYFERFETEIDEIVIEKIDLLQKRFIKLDFLHEEYLNKET